MMRLPAVLFCAAITAMAQVPPVADAMERDAIALARNRDFTRLSKLLRDRSFLGKLDSPASGKTRRLSNIMAALQQNADQETAKLCHTLMADSVFLADPDRQLLILTVLAAVRPMSRQTVDLFATSNGMGYFATDAILLAANGSPLAVDLFESMMMDANVSPANRVECLHFGIIPRRTTLAILQSVSRILAQTKEPQIAAGAVESVFEYRAQWFRPSNVADRPPAWETASKQSLIAAENLATAAQRRRDLSVELRRSVEKELGLIRKALGK